MKHPPRTGVLFAITALIAATFALDLSTPLGIAAPMLYLLPLWLTLWMPMRQAPLLVALACTALTALGYLLSPSGPAASMASGNRLLAISAFGVSALLVRQAQGSRWTLAREVTERARAEEELRRLAQTLEQRVAKRTEELATSRRAALNMMEDAEAARRKAEQAKEAIRASEERFRSVTQSANDAIVSADSRGVILSWNKGATTIFGYEEEEVLGKPLTLLMPERYREAHLQGLKRIQTTGESRVIGRTVELHGLRKDGSEFPLELSLSTWKTWGETFYSAIIRDITEHKRAESELRRRTEQAEVANKELEAFSYSVSHDLRAPLRHIDGFVDLLRRHAASLLDDKGRRYLKTISESAKQMGTLIDDLLDFSRVGRAELHNTTVNLDQLVTNVLQDFRQDMQERTIAWTINPLPSVHGDPALLRQVLVNLIGNAVKYTGTRKEAVIEISALENSGQPAAHSEQPHPHPPLPLEGGGEASSEVVVFVRDNGVGFDMQYAHKLFSVFQRLHGADEFEGTGIGLASVQRIIHRHGGRTWAEGKVDGGATFYFSLPTRREASHDD